MGESVGKYAGFAGGIVESECACKKEPLKKNQ
jgi:hypothetical protein